LDKGGMFWGDLSHLKNSKSNKNSLRDAWVNPNHQFQNLNKTSGLRLGAAGVEPFCTKPLTG